MAALNIPNSVTTTHRAALNAALALLQLNGQCRLVFVDSTHVRLDRFNGKTIVINGALEEIPSAGVTLASTGLSTSTLYYVYAYMSTGTMILEASTTGHAKDASTGVEIKTGDATRTLVGMVYCPYAATFTDSATQRHVASWFNRRQRSVVGAFGANRSITSTSFAPIHVESDASYVSWADDISLGFNGNLNVSANSGALTLYLDGAQASAPGIYVLMTATFVCYSLLRSVTHTEGRHELIVYGMLNVSGTLTVDAWARTYAAPWI